jgi:glycerol-3-phosphate acyltransferase PlsX
MLGLSGIVIKSHGGTDVLGYANAIEIALLEIEKSVPEHIRKCMEPLLHQVAPEQTGSVAAEAEEKEAGITV